MGEKVGFTNCVFEKLCFSENTIFIVFSANPAFQKQKLYDEKKQKIMKNSGLFLNMAKRYFLGFVFLRWFVFVCVCHSSKSVKNACFFCQFLGAFLGWLLLVYLCLEGLGVFVFLVFGYLFGVGFVSVCLLCFVLWLEFVLFLFLFRFVCVCVFFLCFFCFFGGFKGQVRWPEGPPHLALNPAYFLFFFFLFVVLFLLLFLFVFLL